MNTSTTRDFLVWIAYHQQLVFDLILTLCTICSTDLWKHWNLEYRVD